MKAKLRRYAYRLAAFSTGAITLGWLEAFDLVRLSEVWTSVLSSLFSAFVTLLLGGNPSAGSIT